ncbi:uncharacterized protein JCM6883_006189 [Sporobolomyces salmoneus]|uniref:uncharacterized protein n=1 Tax=Sporobolomyces salmoneus TaxID=183962 RepID=UPI00317D3151
MTSTSFAAQPSPPYNPAAAKQSTKNLPPFSSISHSNSNSSSSQYSTPQSVDDPQSRRYSATGAGGGGAYPSVFEIPDPHKKSSSISRNDFGGTGERGLSRVHEEEIDSRNVPNGKKRRAIDEVEGETRERTSDTSRRSSQESSDRRGSNDRNNGIRASFSFPANPHPRPSQPSRNPSNSMPSPPLRNSPSPRTAAPDPRHPQSSERSPPNSSSSKRARTSHGPLDSLAATATDILSSSGSASPSPISTTSNSSSTPPTTAATSIASLIGPPSDAQSKEHQAVFEHSRYLREQQQREIEKRRIASGGGQNSNQPPVGSVQAALGKLKPNNDQRPRNPEREREGEERGAETGLAKRRGHRPPAVSTNSFPPPSNSVVAVTSARSYEEAMRSAPPGIPSVLVGSPVEATWAARNAKGGGGGASSTSNPNAQRQSTSTSGGGGGNPSSSSSTYPQAPNHSNSRSSFSIPSASHPRGHSHQPPSSHLTSAHQPRDRPQHHSANLNAPSHSNPPNLSPTTPHHSYPLHQSTSYDRNQQGSGTRLPPLNLMHLRTGGPNSSSSSSHPYPSHPHSHSQPPLQSAPIPSPPPPPQSQSHSHSQQSASKSAFLSLFSTFFDSLQDSQILTSTLSHQISRSQSLLATLQQSEVVLEQLVDRKMERAREEWGKRLMGEIERRWEGRVERLEGIVMASSRRDERDERAGGVGLGITEQPRREEEEERQRQNRTLMERLDHLERLLLKSSSTNQPGGGHNDSRREKEDERMAGNLPTPHEDKRDRGYSASSSSLGESIGYSDGRTRGGVVAGVDERE